MVPPESNEDQTVSSSDTNIDAFMKSLESASNSSKKQEKLLEKLLDSSILLEKYLKRSPDCKELFASLNETNAALNDLKDSSVSLSINETNTQSLFACLHQAIASFQDQIRKKDDNQLLLIDRNEFRLKANTLCSKIVDSQMPLLKKCLQLKSSNKTIVELQEICVRVLSACVQQSGESAKTVALEFDFFNEHKNWLEKFLLMKNTEIRVYCVEFLISFLKHARKLESGEEAGADSLILIKKIFLPSSNELKKNTPTNNNKNNKKPSYNIQLNLIHCLFVHLSSDPFECVELLLQEVLFKFVQNEGFSKSEKVRMFNEKTLSHLIKLYDWKDKDNDVKQELTIREIITEFLKVLFCSTRFGINFYDRTLGIDLAGKNQNHLIFNSLISIQRSANSDELSVKSNEMIDQLTLKTLKICPDLIQRYLKVKQKQESNQSGELSNEWLLDFCIKLFDQQLVCIESMRKSLSGPASFLRSLNAANIDEPKSFLVSLITHTSLPICFSFQKLLGKPGHILKTLRLLISCLKCVKEWKECVELSRADSRNKNVDLSQIQIGDNLRRIFTSKNDNENFYSKLNLELLTKHLPKFDQFLDNSKSDVLIQTFEIFSLYFDVFMKKTTKPNFEENDLIVDSDLIGSCFNLLQIETLEKSLLKLIPELFNLNEPAVKNEKSLDLVVKYLKFLIKYLSLKQTESGFLSDEIDHFDSVSTQTQTQRKNQQLSNFVRIVFKFKEEFAALAGLYLRLIDAYLISDADSSLLYLFLLSWKKHFFNADEASFVCEDFVYASLSEFLNYKRRSALLFEMSVDGEAGEVDARHCLFFICAKNFVVLRQSCGGGRVERVEAFLVDLLLGSGLVSEAGPSLDVALNSRLLEKELAGDGKEILDGVKRKVKESFEAARGREANGSAAEAFMALFEQCTQLKVLGASKNLTTLALNFELRFSHLLFLLKQLVQNNEAFKVEKDLHIISANLRNCLENISKLSEMWKKCAEADEDDQSVLMEKSDVHMWLERVKQTLQGGPNQAHVNNTLNLELISEFPMDKASFTRQLDSLIDENCVKNECTQEFLIRFNLFTKVLIKNANAHIFHNSHNLFNDFDLDKSHLNSLETLFKYARVLLSYLAKFSYDKVLVEKNEGTHLSLYYTNRKTELVEFLQRAYELKPCLFKIAMKLVCGGEDAASCVKNLRKFSANSFRLKQIFDVCLSNEESRSESKLSLNEIKFKETFLVDEKFAKEMKSKSVEKLVKVYAYTMSKKDRIILREIFNSEPDLNCLMFKTDDESSLDKQAVMADFISAKIDASLLANSTLNFPIHRKLDDLSAEEEEKCGDAFEFDSLLVDDTLVSQAKIYDPVYLLPNFYHLLDFSNIVDVVQFVQTKCLSYLLAALSTECKRLRSIAYASIHRFMSHLENTRAYFKNLIGYLINLLRNSSDKENFRLPNVVSTFLAEAVMVIIEPGTHMYKPIMSFLLLKPTLDLTNVPEFYKLFNSSSLQHKIERKWILNVLAHGCRNSVDYRLFEKRFIFRQLLSIYDSRLSDLDTKTQILTLLFEACKCKYSLADLIKRHYLLVWMSSVLEKNSTRANAQNEAAVKIFHKLMQMFILIWKQLGSSRVLKSADGGEVLTPPPLTFLNQMFVLSKILFDKLISFNSKLNEIKFEFSLTEKNKNKSELLDAANNENLPLAKLMLASFFKIRNEIVEGLRKYELNMSAFAQVENTNLVNELEKMKPAEISYETVMTLLETRKRACHSFDSDTIQEKRIRLE